MRLVALLFCLTLAPAVFSQEADSLAKVADTGHSVRKAVIFSAVIPGAGQIYNHLAMPKGQKKAYWKVPLIYAGLGATGYFMIKTNKVKNDLRSEYESRDAGNAPVLYQEYDQTGIATLYKTKRTQRDLCIIGMSLVYILNVVDAGVEAHFVHFDIGEDLSLALYPALLPNNGFGVGATLNFHQKRP